MIKDFQLQGVRDVIVDVTYRHDFHGSCANQQRNGEPSHLDVNGALDAAVKEKLDHYQHDYNERNFFFLPDDVSFKRLVEQMKSGGLNEDESDDKTFKYELVSSGGVKRKIGAGEEKHTIPVQGSCNKLAEAVKHLSSYSKGVRQSLKDRFVDITTYRFLMSCILRVCLSLTNLLSAILECKQVSGLLEIYGKDIERSGQCYPPLLSDSTLAQY